MEVVLLAGASRARAATETLRFLEENKLGEFIDVVVLQWRFNGMQPGDYAIYMRCRISYGSGDRECLHVLRCTLFCVRVINIVSRSFVTSQTAGSTANGFLNDGHVWLNCLPVWAGTWDKLLQEFVKIWVQKKRLESVPASWSVN